MQGKARDWPPVLVPILTGREAIADPFAEACAEAASLACPGLVLYSRDDYRIGMAITLTPDDATRDSTQMLHVLMVASCDAIGALSPPEFAAQLRWPATLLANGAPAGRFHLACAPGADTLPEWLVVGIDFVRAKQTKEEEPGAHPDRTGLDEEGLADVGSGELIAAFARYFLVWLRRWEEDGFALVQRAWMARAETKWLGVGASGSGFLRLAMDGAAIISREGGETRQELLAALALRGDGDG